MAIEHGDKLRVIAKVTRRGRARARRAVMKTHHGRSLRLRRKHFSQMLELRSFQVTVMRAGDCRIEKQQRPELEVRAIRAAFTLPPISHSRMPSQESWLPAIT
jgi:hypothetical protein